MLRLLQFLYRLVVLGRTGRTPAAGHLDPAAPPSEPAPSTGAATDVLQPLIPLVPLLWLIVNGLLTPAPVAPPADLSRGFRAAISDAAVRSDNEVYGGLVPLTQANNDLRWKTAAKEDVLAVAFVSKDDATKYYANADGTPREGQIFTPGDRPRVWVTLAPQVQRFCRGVDARDVATRLKQYLGLDPLGPYDTVVEMWVSPKEVFRPCPDPQVDDNVCSLRTPADVQTVEKIEDYPAFLLSLYQNSYREGGAPWTGLGYTYDYAHGERGIGASEYMLVPGARYEVSSVARVAAYCASPG